MSFETVRQQSSVFSTGLLCSSLSKLWSFGKWMMSSKFDIDAASPRMYRKTAREVTTLLARLE